MAMLTDGRGTATMAVLACALFAPPAGAEAEPIRIVYQAGRDCPGVTQLVREIDARTPNARSPVGDEAARTFELAVSADAGSTRGVLEITGVDGSVSRREVEGQSCQEVVSAAAFMIALAVDPATATPGPAPAVTSDAAPEPPMPVPPAPPAIEVRSPTRPSPERVPPPRRVHPAARWRYGFGAQGQVLAGFVPAAAAAGGVFVDLAQASSSPFAPSFRLSLYSAATHVTFADGVGTQLSWFMGRLEGCPARVGPAWLFVTACAHVEAGLLVSQGTGLANGHQENRGWVIPGGLTRVTWAPSRDSWVEGSAGIGLPLERYAFRYDRPERTVQAFRIPAAGSEVGLAVGYRSP